MKVKLHKGPFHGKVMDVLDSMLFDGLILAKTDNRFNTVYYNYSSTVPSYTSVNTYTQVKYEPVMMGVNIGGTAYRAPAMHPDGYVYMVYKGEV